MLEQAIARYHDLLDVDTARATHEQLIRGLRERQLFFGDRPLSTVLRPRFISAPQYQQLQQACELVGNASRRIANAAHSDDSIRADLMLTPGEEALIRMDPGYNEPSAHSRMDTFMTIDGSSLQFVEYNAESPAAIAYQDVLSEVFLELPAMQRFAREYRINALPARHRLLETLLEAWQAFGGKEQPTIAIVDWRGLPTYTEFLLFQDYFRQQGLQAVICAPEDLRYDGTTLTAEVDGSSVPVNLIYKRVLTSEFLLRYADEALDHPLVRAYADGKACVVNSFRAKLLHKKSLFALLTDDSREGFFTEDERAAIQKHVPWTRVVRAGPSTYQGEQIDLLPFLRDQQERLVLKPNDEYGGKGILIGWETSAEDWNSALQEATQTPSVVQERVEIAYEDYPSFVDGKVQLGRRLVDSDPFMFGSKVSGCLTRLSTVTLLNVTAGGGSTVPAFVIEPLSGT